ncbi:Fic family protein, partial [Bacillus haynesii]
VFYQFKELDNLEGAYSPDKDGYPAAVLININRPFRRQRFTCAHELCHHLKDYDREEIICPKGSKSSIEQYANSFASNILMPRKYFIEEANKISNEEGYLDPKDAFKLCIIFGTSYQAVMWRLHNLGFLSFDLYLNQGIFKTVKPNDYLQGVDDNLFLSHIINQYEYYPVKKHTHLWLKFQYEYVFNDNRMEGLHIEIKEVSEILTDIRLKRQESEHIKLFYKDEMKEVVGHSLIYEYINEKEEPPDRYELLELHKLLYSLCPHSNLMGKFRTTNNFVTNTDLITTDFSNIETEIYQVCGDIEYLIHKKERMTVADYISLAAKIHHRLTQIHPFNDGNGRITRAALNWLFKLGNLPPVYIPYELKEEYVEALKKADKWEYDALDCFFYKRTLASFIELNEMFSTIEEDDELIYHEI